MTPLWLAALLAATPAAPGPLLVMRLEGGEAVAEAAWVGELVAESLPQALRAAGTPAVEGADRLRAQAALEIPPALLSRATCIRIGEALGADRLVLGSYSLKGPELAVSVRLLDAERGTLSAPFVVSGREEEILPLVGRLAWDLALASSTQPHQTREAFLAGLPSPPFPAVKAFGQGLAARDPASRTRLIRSALALAPDYHAARLALGRLEVEARDFQAALDTLGKIPEGVAEARPARFLQVVAMLSSGHYRGAAALSAQLIADQPSPAALSNHALALLRGGPGELKASDVLRKALELAPTSTDVAFNLAWALLSEGNAEAAIFHLRAVLREEPLDAHARLVLAWALARAGQDSEAQQEWRGVLAMTPSYAGLSNPDLSRRFERVMVSERLLVVDRGTRSEAEVAAGLIGRAEKLSASGDASGALRELTRAAYLDPYAPRIHQLLARAHLRSGDKEKAANEYRMALWSREDATVRLELAQLLQEMGRLAEAKAEAQRVLEVDPPNQLARKILSTAPPK